MCVCVFVGCCMSDMMISSSIVQHNQAFIHTLYYTHALYNSNSPCVSSGSVLILVCAEYVMVPLCVRMDVSSLFICFSSQNTVLQSLENYLVSETDDEQPINCSSEKIVN